MTFGVRHIVGVTTNSKRAGWLGTKAPLFGSSWENKNLFGTWTAEDVWKYLVGCHLSHTTELAVAFCCYRLFFADGTWLSTCAEFKIGWVGHVDFAELLRFDSFSQTKKAQRSTCAGDVP